MWAAVAPGLKTIEDAIEIRGRILRAVRRTGTGCRGTPCVSDGRHRGAGPTGAELAGALSEIANDTLRNDFRHINPADSAILLTDGAAKAEQALHAESRRAVDHGTTDKTKPSLAADARRYTPIKSRTYRQELSSHMDHKMDTEDYRPELSACIGVHRRLDMVCFLVWFGFICVYPCPSVVPWFAIAPGGPRR